MLSEKEKLLKKIAELPEDIQVFSTEGEYNDIDLKIFTIPKDKKFLAWFFGV